MTNTNELMEANAFCLHGVGSMFDALLALACAYAYNTYVRVYTTKVKHLHIISKNTQIHTYTCKIYTHIYGKIHIHIIHIYIYK